ncbi:MAG: M23 family metallopeptidase [Pseudoflavonifractor sp.]|nr:M23 family metallopeptidase [Pseudoflavonifractor sp.]
MDEILLDAAHARSAPAASSRTARLRMPSRQDVQKLLRAVPYHNFLERRSPLDPLIYLVAALSVASAAVLGSLYGPSYSVSVDGVDLGLVQSRQAVETAIDRVEARAGNILGHSYTLEQDVSYRFALSQRDERISVSQVETYLFDQIGEVMKTSVLTVNGQLIGAADDETALEGLLDSIKAPYVTANTISAQCVQPVVATKEYTSTSELKDVESMRSLLTANSMEEVAYTVQAGDTFSGIANSRGMRMSDLQALNPDVDINNLMVGQTLTISQAVPFLSVQTVDRLTYDGPVAYPVQEVADDTMYQGDTKVLTVGADGLAAYNADVTYLNGVEQSQIINSSTVLKEPVTQVVAVGTKERPRTMATGHLKWPLYGSISSGYGYRSIFGSYSFHTGLDITGSYGAAIAAADGGKVIFAGTGTGSYWSYGRYVVIDHENGIQTIYAHCSSLNVNAGDRVYQGQVIARVGSTGRATGNHCHFQVMVNGTTVNPYNYLP